MTKRDIVEVMAHILPEKIFTSIRRKYQLCRFNYHSAVKVRPASSGGAIAGLFANCKHCGQLVERDRSGQWRTFPVGLFSADPQDASHVVGAPSALAIPMTATESGSYLINDGLINEDCAEAADT